MLTSSETLNISYKSGRFQIEYSMVERKFILTVVNGVLNATFFK